MHIQYMAECKGTNNYNIAWITAHIMHTYDLNPKYRASGGDRDNNPDGHIF